MSRQVDQKLIPCIMANHTIFPKTPVIISHLNDCYTIFRSSDFRSCKRGKYRVEEVKVTGYRVLPEKVTANTPVVVALHFLHKHSSVGYVYYIKLPTE